MANEVTKGVEGVPQVSQSAAIFQSLVELAKDTTVDAVKMTALVDLQMKIMDRDAQSEFNRDKIAALMEMPTINKKGAIIHPGKDGRPDRVQSRYSRFEDIMAIVKPILDRHKLVLTFNVGHNGQMVTVQPILSHANGIVEKGGDMSLPLDTTGSKNGTQGAGSAAAYGKRHSAKAMLNIVEVYEDDDGQLGKGVAADASDEEQDIINEGQIAATSGTAAYMAWFKALAPRWAAMMIYKGGHDGLKRAAAEHG